MSQEVPVFRPNFEEFSNFSKFIEYMELAGAHHVGIAKVGTNEQEKRSV